LIQILFCGISHVHSIHRLLIKKYSMVNEGAVAIT